MRVLYLPKTVYSTAFLPLPEGCSGVLLQTRTKKEHIKWWGPLLLPFSEICPNEAWNPKLLRHLGDWSLCILSVKKSLFVWNFNLNSVVCSNKRYYLFPDKPLAFGCWLKHIFIVMLNVEVDYAWQYVYHCLLKLWISSMTRKLTSWK